MRQSFGRARSRLADAREPNDALECALNSKGGAGSVKSPGGCGARLPSFSSKTLVAHSRLSFFDVKTLPTRTHTQTRRAYGRRHHARGRSSLRVTQSAPSPAKGAAADNGPPVAKCVGWRVGESVRPRDTTATLPYMRPRGWVGCGTPVWPGKGGLFDWAKTKKKTPHSHPDRHDRPTRPPGRRRGRRQASHRQPHVSAAVGCFGAANAAP